jgi:hypothetical protein
LASLHPCQLVTLLVAQHSPAGGDVVAYRISEEAAAEALEVGDLRAEHLGRLIEVDGVNDGRLVGRLAGVSHSGDSWNDLRTEL